MSFILHVILKRIQLSKSYAYKIFLNVITNVTYTTHVRYEVNPSVKKIPGFRA